MRWSLLRSDHHPRSKGHLSAYATPCHSPTRGFGPESYHARNPTADQHPDLPKRVLHPHAYQYTIWNSLLTLFDFAGNRRAAFLSVRQEIISLPSISGPVNSQLAGAQHRRTSSPGTAVSARERPEISTTRPIEFGGGAPIADRRRHFGT